MDTDTLIMGAVAALPVIYAVQRAIPKLEAWADSDGDDDDFGSRAVRVLRAACGVLASALELIVGRRG